MVGLHELTKRQSQFIGGQWQPARQFGPAKRRLFQGGRGQPDGGRKILLMRQRKERGVVQREPFAGIVREFECRDVGHLARDNSVSPAECEKQKDMRGENQRDKRQPPAARPRAFARRFLPRRSLRRSPGGSRQSGRMRFSGSGVHGAAGTVTTRGNVASSAFWMPASRASSTR